MQKYHLARFMLVITAVMFMPLSYGQIFEWIDENGKQHFGDRLPNGEFELITPRTDTYNGEVTFGTALYDHSRRFGTRQVVIYSARWCDLCQQAKRFMRRKGIAFTEFDIEKNMRNKKRYARLNAKGVPVIFAGMQRMNGFTESGFRQLFR